MSTVKRHLKTEGHFTNENNSESTQLQLRAEHKTFIVTRL